jgi:YD repeat-containing protein
MRKLKIVSALLSALTLSFSSFAGVNLKNGNFYISYTDIVVPGGGQKLEMTRTYNSKSTEVGWFGFGWGNIFETKLSASADGCVVIQEHGGGAKTRFCPESAVDAEVAAKKVVDAMRKKSTISDKNAEQLIKRLKNNAELRHAYAKQFGVKTNIAAGTKLFSNQRGIQKLVKTKDGYVRTSNDGKSETFSDAGQLVEIKTKNGYKTSFTYKKNKLHSIKDSKAKQLFFEWYSNGRVKHLWSAGDKKALYKYKGKNLVFSRDVAGNEYEFAYDKNHNLTKIIYNPNRKKGEKEDSMKMTYESKTFFVSSITDRNGETTKYKYESDPKNPSDHYWTLVTKKGFSGKPVTNRYEYEIKTKPDGSRYTYRIKTVINGIDTETIYSECCSLPLKIKRGNQVTSFDYNDKGLLTKKSSTRGEYVEIEYDKKLNKISKVVNKQGWTKFKYDKKGNLKTAENKVGQRVLLVYDSKGKITKMVDAKKNSKDKRVLSFKYNSMGKPAGVNLNM